MCRELVKVLNPRLRFSDELWRRAELRAAAAAAGLDGGAAEPERSAAAPAGLGAAGADIAAALEKRGFSVEYRSLSFPGVWVWGRVVPDGKKVFIDREALKIWQERLARLSREDFSERLESLVLAHELFHIADPGCPAELAELAAAIFSLKATGLAFRIKKLSETNSF
ncbi:hypothetical protein IJT93_06405 [bacterium]|nr:hypothetical protein [bacterium]